MADLPLPIAGALRPPANYEVRSVFLYSNRQVMDCIKCIAMMQRLVAASSAQTEATSRRIGQSDYYLCNLPRKQQDLVRPAGRH